jgi:hypothetical protein
LAGDAVGTLVLRHPDAAADLDAGAGDEDFWVRRSALLAQLRPLRAGADLDRFGRYADAILDETESFVRKAIGWVPGLTLSFDRFRQRCSESDSSKCSSCWARERSPESTAVWRAGARTARSSPACAGSFSSEERWIGLSLV